MFQSQRTKRIRATDKLGTVFEITSLLENKASIPFIESFDN